MLQLLVQIYKLSHTVLRTKARVVKVKHDSHRLTGKSEQNITTNLSRWNPREKGRRLSWYDILVLFVAQCTLVKSGAVYSG